MVSGWDTICPLTTESTTMKLTLDIDEQVLARASKIADAQETTLTALVTEYLTSLAGDNAVDRKAQAARLMETFERLSRKTDLRGWSRDDLYEERLGKFGD